MILFAWICGVVVAISMQTNNIIIGDSIDDFTAGGKFSFCDQNVTNYDEGVCALTLQFMTPEETELMKNMEDPNKMITESMTENTTLLITLACVVWFCAYIQTSFLMITSERLDTNILTAVSELTCLSGLTTICKL